MKSKTATDAYRTSCNICGAAFDGRRMKLFPIRCNVRKFAHEVFHMWRCPECRTMHCRERVDLDTYYAGYGAHRQQLDFFLRLAYSEQLRRFRKAGMKRTHRFLDYGCAGGQLVTYLRTNGYQNATGYDPYGEPDGCGDASVLDAGGFDYICLQEVIEHVEEPRPLLKKLADLLRPGGHVLVGMPDGGHMGLDEAEMLRHHLHVPYHLHIYTRATLDRLAADVGLAPTASYSRFYADSLFFGMNEVFFRTYVDRIDGTVDALLDPIHFGKIFTSPVLLFHGAFGYLYSGGHSITVLYRKQP